MKKGQIYTGVVERMDFPNKGIVIVREDREDGISEEFSCVVKNVLPGQKVTFLINKFRKGKAEGRLLEVAEPAENEIHCSCRHYGKCGGCLYLSLTYEDQLKIKEDQVRRLLKNCLEGKQGEWKFEGIKASPAIYEYRNKMEFSFGDEIKDGPLSLGMHKRGSFYDVVTVDGCCIVDEDYRQILSAVLHFFQERRVSFYHRLRHEGYLRHLLIRKAVKTGEILVALVTSSQWEGKKSEDKSQESEVLEAWKEMLLKLKLEGRIVGILHLLNDSVADVVKSDRTDVLYGQDYFYEELLGLKFKISTFSFFQTNSLGAEVLYQTVREYIGDLKVSGKEADKVVFDLYSGTGTIAQLMAPVAKKVVGVEIVSEAVEAARKNAALNGLSNCEFLAGDVLKVLDSIGDKPDLILLDPPRDGVHPKALKKIIDYGVERLIYVSCKPTSLVRDLEIFLENGYQVERAVAVDQFPWTGNVETVILLSQKTPDVIIEIDLEMSELDLTRAESKATYKEIEEYVQNKYGLHVTNLYIAQVKREFGIIERINYNVGDGKSRVPQVTPEKREAIIDALKYFQMIEV